MKVLNNFTKVKSNTFTYFDLSPKDRKKIITNAIKKSDIEQYNLVKEYRGHTQKYQISNYKYCDIMKNIK